MIYESIELNNAWEFKKTFTTKAYRQKQRCARKKIPKRDGGIFWTEELPGDFASNSLRKMAYFWENELLYRNFLLLLMLLLVTHISLSFHFLFCFIVWRINLNQSDIICRKNALHISVSHQQHFCVWQCEIIMDLTRVILMWEMSINKRVALASVYKYGTHVTPTYPN